MLQDQLTMLIVEDEPIIRMCAADFAEEQGYSVLEAEDAGAALDLLECHEIQVLFTDINLPGRTNGLELAAIVRERWPQTRVLISSGRSGVGGSAFADEVVFLPKPYNMIELSEALSALVGS